MSYKGNLHNVIFFPNARRRTKAMSSCNEIEREYIRAPATKKKSSSETRARASETRLQRPPRQIKQGIKKGGIESEEEKSHMRTRSRAFASLAT